MAKLKGVFHVEDEDKNVVVEKSQMFLEIGDDPHSSLTIPELARDHLAENVAILKVANDTGDMSTEERLRMGENSRRQGVIGEFMTAAGDLIQRYVRLKLRDWAKGQLEKV
jgi:hypothetical protein